MQDVNWWLMVLSFLLGLVLSLALMIRRVKREVPEYAALGRGPGVDVKAPDADVKGAGLAAGGAAAGGAAAAKFAGDTTTEKIPAAVDEPYGPGSVRVAGGAAAPSGYDIKGNEDSMLYHTTDSPSYKQTIAEIWFRDVETAEKAGFHRWDSGESQRGQR